MKKLISFRMMTVEDMLNKIVCGLPSCQVCKPYRDEILRRFNEQEERIKELEGIVKNYQDTCEKMINR